MRKVLFLLFLLCINGLMVYAQTAKVLSQLHVYKLQLKDTDGKDIVLRGMAFGYSPRFWNAGAVKWLKEDWDCTVVRASMDVNQYIKDTNAIRTRLEVVVDAAIKEGLYVIIDWHTDEIQLNAAKVFFREMAEKYSKYPNIIYEIFNEPAYHRGTDSSKGLLYTWPEVKEYSIELISTIRAIDPNNIILVGCPRWDQSINLPADDPIIGYNNLMYTVHYYAAGHKQELCDRADYALSKGLPIFISESADTEATGKGNIDVKEWDRWIKWSEKNKISWITWEMGDLKETCSVL